MLNPRNNLVVFYTSILLATFLYGCGDTDPGLENPPSYADSALGLSIPVTGNQLQFEWDAIADVTQYRLRQTTGETQVIPVDGLIINGLSTTIDVTKQRYDTFGSHFVLEAFDLADGWVEVGEQNALGTEITGSELRFSWDEYEGATEYRLKQLTGDAEVIPGGELIINAVAVTLDTSDLDYIASQISFSLEANVPVDGVDTWVMPEEESLFSAIRVDFPSLLRFSIPFAGRTIQFFWQAVDGAGGYRLTQSAGRLDILSNWKKYYTVNELNDQFQVPVHLFDWEDSRFVLEACMDGTVINDVCTGGQWEILGEQVTRNLSSRLISSYTATADAFSPQPVFGSSVALAENGTTMAVGATGDAFVPEDQRVCPEVDPEIPPEEVVECNADTDIFVAPGSGAVYLFDFETGEQVILKAPNTAALDFFGKAIALSDDGMTLAVSAPFEDSNAAGVFPQFDPEQDNSEAADSGAVYIYALTAGSWELEAYIKAPNPDSLDWFGTAVELSGDGNRLVVSSVFEDGSVVAPLDPANNELESSGAVFVYSRLGSTWSQEYYLKASMSEAQDQFGQALTLSADGNYLAVAAIEAGTSNQNSQRNAQGAVYVYWRDDSVLTEIVWTEIAYLKASNAGAEDYFGQSISFNSEADMLVVGAPLEDHLASGFTAVSAGNESFSVGAAYLFQRSGEGLGSSWIQATNYLKASNPNLAAEFGQSVSLSSDGNYIAVGAWGDASAGFGINGNQSADNQLGSGAVYVFGRIDGSDIWEQKSFIKAGVRAPQLFFGSHLDLAKNGHLLAVSANGVDPAGRIWFSPGYVFLY